MTVAAIIGWINFAVLIASALLFWFFYTRSAQPAALEKEIGEAAYRRCARYRSVAAVLMLVASANYVVYYFYPLPVGLPRTFPWPWWVSAVVAVLIALPSGYLWYRGVRDAGEETLVPKKEHALYGGIYEKIRHPQAVSELVMWWVIAFFLHSPFLALFSFVWAPIFYAVCLAEERDLVLRYGEAYNVYRQNTGFFFPKLRAAR
jgi:protein-S-isoprenylcysteine O-methyltransferase Ste14